MPPVSTAGGRRARQALGSARDRVAQILNAKPDEIVFTSGGSEGANLAVKGAAWARQQRGKHIITSAVEHPPAVLDAVLWLERSGFAVTVLPVDGGEGTVTPEAVRAALRPPIPFLFQLCMLITKWALSNPSAKLVRLCATAVSYSIQTRSRQRESSSSM